MRNHSAAMRGEGFIDMLKEVVTIRLVVEEMKVSVNDWPLLRREKMQSGRIFHG